jgi:NAD(P)-dependent dehydrogenase (short-subunit alcohol dehydrogenase family)
VPVAELTNASVIVTGASRGFGRAIALELSARGARVVGVARGVEQLDALQNDIGDHFTAFVGDASDPEVARDLIQMYRPKLIVLNAGAQPVTGPIHEQTWDSFNTNWNVDTQQAFHWSKEALRTPLEPGSVVISISSGAAIGGSPLSGGYASSKAAVRFIGAYAAAESSRSGLGIRFLSLLPQLTPLTDLGAAGAAVYAKNEGIDVETFLDRFKPLLTPEKLAEAVYETYENEDSGISPHLAYLVSGAGIKEL